MSEPIRGLDKLLSKLEAAKGSIERKLTGALLRGGLAIAGEAQRNVSGPRPDKLGVVTGRLRTSIVAVVVSRYQVKVGTNVSYAAIHEFGGRTPARVIRPRTKKALSWTGAGGEVFTRRSVNHPGSNIPARPYMRPALETKRQQAVRIVRAVYAGPLMLGGSLV